MPACPGVAGVRKHSKVLRHCTRLRLRLRSEGEDRAWQPPARRTGARICSGCPARRHATASVCHSYRPDGCGRHHAVRDFLRLGRRSPPVTSVATLSPAAAVHGAPRRGRRREASPGRSAGVSGARPDAFRSSSARPWPANATSSRQSRHRSPAELRPKVQLGKTCMAYFGPCVRRRGAPRRVPPR